MGLLFQEYIENVSLNCRLCDMQLIDVHDVLYKNIETTNGESIIVKNVMNVMFSYNTKTSSLNMYDTFITFDDDCPFVTSDTGTCNEIYCKKCMFHIGFKDTKHEKHVFICFKNVLS